MTEVGPAFGPELTPSEYLEQNFADYPRPEVELMNLDGEPVEPLSPDGPIFYLTEDKLYSQASFLDRVEDESVDKGYTGPRVSFDTQITDCIDHLNGAIHPEDDGIYYAVKSEEGQMDAYVFTYAPDEDHIEEAGEAGMLDGVGENVLWREVSPFVSKGSTITDQQMVSAMRASLTADMQRFFSKENTDGIAFVIYESGDEDDAMLIELGFERKGVLEIEVERPSETDLSQIVEVMQDHAVWVLTGSAHEENIVRQEGGSSE